jgi:preprotein translocase subunit SecD
VAPSAGTLRVGRYFLALFALFVVLYAIVFWPNQPKTPKLGLDLEGGAQVVVQAQTDDGSKPTKQAMNQAKQIINNRVNGLGVANAEVVIQGSNQIVVSVPGRSKDLSDVTRAALLQFRPELQAATAVTPPKTASPSPSSSPSASTSGTAKPSASATAKSSATAKASPSPHGRVVPHLAGSTSPAKTTPAKTTPAPSGSTSKPSGTPSPTPSTDANSIFHALPAGSPPVDQWARIAAIAKLAKITFTPPTTAAALAALDQNGSQLLQAAIAEWPCDENTRPVDDPTKPLITCDDSNTQRFLLGPVIVQGKEVKSARAIAPGSQQGQAGWIVSVSLKPSGQAKWAKYTSQHNEQVSAGAIENTVANTLDSKVIPTPSVIQETINGDTQISGGFNSTSATNLANSLKYGALPLNFITKTNTTVSATLGTDQLKAGLLAGGIGLVLVIVYSLMYYRALGLVTIASLLVSGGLTYAMLVILAKQIGFTLTLAGIAGFIVAVGITADSFVVFFERIKDEVHEGRSSRVAIPRAWNRARRTIISADTVSLLAAVILYYFAAGEVKGFAFTLGMSTILDLIVVFLFTHPLVSMFSRSSAFGSARFTGLNHVRPGGLLMATAGGPGDLLVEDGVEDEAPVADRSKPKRAPRTPREGPAKPVATPRKSAPVAADAADAIDDTAPDEGRPHAADSADGTPAQDITAPPKAPTRVAVGATAAERAAARRARQNADPDSTDGADK